MRAISLVRQRNLLYLIEQYGSIARLNLALGRPKKDATLSQVKNFAKHHKTNKPREMGVALARSIEEKLNYPPGWMDKEHPEIQPIPENQEDIKSITEEKKASSLKLTVIPLFEIRRRSTDGRFVPFKIGNVQMPDIFIEKSAYPIRAEKAESFYVDELTSSDLVPYGSIVILDKSVRNYTKDGLYLVELNGSVVFRKIISSAKGGFIVQSSSTNSEHIQNLETLKILGFGVFIWVQQAL
mgnify:FL=1